LRQKLHDDQVVVKARYLGLQGRWLDGGLTNRRCDRDDEITGVVRFALAGENPWRASGLADTIEAELPCPELSRPDYAKLYRYSPDDRQRDRLGHAPVLRPSRATLALSTPRPATRLRNRWC
jgi:hypothetical protein